MKEESPNTGLIDIHSHILPKADDGSRYFGETADMLKRAYRQGVRGVIATPHYICRRNRMKSREIREIFHRVKQMTAGELPDLSLYLGEELFYFDGALEALEAGHVLTLNETHYVLVEFPVNVTYGELFRALRKLELACYIPVLAHIERYECLQEDPGLVDELIHAGAYMQINYGSLTGIRYLKRRSWCRKMILDGRVHLLGSDMHRLDYRPPELEDAVKWLRKKGMLDRLAIENPRKLLEGKPIE